MKSKIIGLFLCLITLFTFFGCGNYSHKNYSHKYVPESFQCTLKGHALWYKFKVELETDRYVNVYYEIQGRVTDSSKKRYDFYYKGAVLYLIKDSSSKEITVDNMVDLNRLIKHHDVKETYKLEKVSLHKIDIVDIENGDQSINYVYYLSGIGFVAAFGLVIGCFIKNETEKNKLV